MERVKLYTADGGFVVEAVVPPWKVPVECYVWGERFFIRREGSKGLAYYEARGVFAILQTTDAKE